MKILTGYFSSTTSQFSIITRATFGSALPKKVINTGGVKLDRIRGPPVYLFDRKGCDYFLLSATSVFGSTSVPKIMLRLAPISAYIPIKSRRDRVPNDAIFPSTGNNIPMGSYSFEQAPASLVNDLKVSLHRSSTLTPLEKTERRAMFLSNIEQVLNFDVETIHFFRASPNFTPENVADQLEMALRKLLVPYDFLAGRLRFNPQVGRLEIECNTAGMAFAVASSPLTLEEIGELAYPNPAFRQLVFSKEPLLAQEDQPLMRLQVVTVHRITLYMGLISSWLASFACIACRAPIHIGQGL
ncbi:hypothetical protein ACLOJK_011910 [Asimina triloba]